MLREHRAGETENKGHIGCTPGSHHNWCFLRQFEDLISIVGNFPQKSRGRSFTTKAQESLDRLVSLR